MGQKLAYLAEYTDANGVHHTAVHFYDRVTGMVWMMRDVKFDGMRYPETDAEMLMYQQEHDAWKKSHPMFIVKCGHYNDAECFNVWNTSADNVVAVFFNEDEASQYAEVLNQNDMYLDDASSLEDDPML